MAENFESSGQNQPPVCAALTDQVTQFVNMANAFLSSHHAPTQEFHR